jgi:predicted MFS family arabinose efflux permease
VQGVLVGPLARRLGERALVSVGFLVVAASMFLIPRCTGLSHLVFALALWASGGALASPSLFSLISRQARASTQGRVLGLAQSATGMARVVGPAWGGFAFDHFGRQAPCLTGGALMAVASLASLALFHPGLQPPTPVQPTPPPASPPASPPVLPAALPPASPPVSAPAASPFFSTSPPSPLL